MMEIAACRRFPRETIVAEAMASDFMLCAMQLFRLLFLQFRLCQRECTISKPNARAPVGTYCCKIVPIRFLEKGSGNQCLHKCGKEEKQKKSYQKEFYTKK